MSIGFVLGPSGSGKSEYLKNLVIRESKENPGRKYLYIVPDQYTLQTQKSMIEKHPDKAFSNIEVLNFSRLSHRILEEIGGEEIPVLDDTGKSLIIRHISEDIKGELKVFGSKIDRIGFIHEVKSAISEFMQYGVSPDGVTDLARLSTSRPALSYKLTDLAVLYKAFMTYKGNNYRTREETLEVVREGICKSKLVSDAFICFDGFTGFTPIQERVIQELLKYSAQVLLSFDMDEGMDPSVIEGEQELFYLSKKSIATLRRLADEVNVCEEETVFLGRRSRNKQIDHLERNLFRYPYKPLDESGEDIHIYRAGRVRDEITDTCQRIKSLTDNEGYRYCDIAVVVGNLAAYADDFKEIAQDFDIPVYMDYSRSVLMLPFIEAIRSAYDVVEYDFMPESVIRHIRCGFGPLNREECDELENFLLRTGIRGYSGYKKYWDVSFVGRGEESDAEKAERILRAERLNAYREKILSHFDFLMTKEASAEEHSRALYGFFEYTGARLKLDSMAEEFKEQQDFVRAIEYSQLFKKICDLMDQIVLLIGQEQMTREEYRDILEAGFGEIKIGIIPQEMDRVLVGDIERTRLSDVKALFFLGVNDGNIPSGISSGGIISDMDKEFLKQTDVALAPTPRDQMFIQRLYLYMNLTKPSNKLYVSFSQMDVEGKSIRPSYLIGMLHNLFPAITIEESTSTHMVKDTVMPAGKHLVKMELAAYMREYAMGRLSQSEIGYMQDMALAMTERGYEEVYEQIVDSAFMEFQNESLAKELATAIYGKAVKISISRIEKYATCAYAHFLQYGMKLKEREEYSFEKNNMGDVFHQALEQFAHKLEEESMTWTEYSESQADKWVEEILDRIAATYKETIMLSSNRRVAMKNRMSRILKRTVDSIQYQVGKGKFIPTEFEYRFTQNKELEIDDEQKIKMIINGVIDRVDLCADEETGNEYVRIVDYKSGTKDFDIVSLYYGQSLQLAIYMAQAMDKRMNMHEKAGDTCAVKPGGMLYQKIHDPVVKIVGDVPEDKISNERRKMLKLTGVLPDDRYVLALNDKDVNGPGGKSDILPVGITGNNEYDKGSRILGTEDFDRILKFAQKKMLELAAEMYSGNMASKPRCIKGKSNPCEYCAFKDICLIDSELPGYGVEMLDKKEADEILTEMREQA